MSENSRDADKFMLRLPNGMRDEIKIKAAMNRRSMNAEVVIQLERAYGLGAAAGERFGDTTPAAAENTAA